MDFFSQSTNMNSCQSKEDCKIIKVLNKAGYEKAHKTSPTQQGNIWTAEACDKSSVCIKVVDKKLFEESITHEDVMKEKTILKYITQQQQCPNSIVKYIDFFKSRSSLFLIMENGGSCLFNFIQRAHEHINAGVIDIAHWKQVVYIIFTQMVEAIEYIHSLNIAHFDISLENWLINDVPITVEELGQIQKVSFDLDDIQIKLCDFGLAQQFTSDQCLSNKFCGKATYSSEEVVRETYWFDPKSNDIHCLGICFFMCVTGGPPWEIAHVSDQNFVYVKKNSIFQLLCQWNILHYADQKTIILLEAMLKSEKNRADINAVKKYLDSKVDSLFV